MIKIILIYNYTMNSLINQASHLFQCFSGLPEVAQAQAIPNKNSASVPIVAAPVVAAPAIPDTGINNIIAKFESKTEEILTTARSEIRDVTEIVHSIYTYAKLAMEKVNEVAASILPIENQIKALTSRVNIVEKKDNDAVLLAESVKKQLVLFENTNKTKLAAQAKSLKEKNRKLKLITLITNAFMNWAITELARQQTAIVQDASLIYTINNFFAKFVNTIYLDANENIFEGRSGKITCFIPNIGIDELMNNNGIIDRILIWSYRNEPWYLILNDGELQMSHGFNFINCENITYASKPHTMFRFEKCDQIARLVIDPSGRKRHYFRVEEEAKAGVGAYNSLTVDSGYKFIDSGFAMIEFG